MKNSMFIETEFIIKSPIGGDTTKVTEVTGGLSPGPRQTQSRTIAFDSDGLDNCINYIESICTNQILTIDAGGMMSFIRGIAGVDRQRLVPTTTIFNMFDSATGNYTPTTSQEATYSNELFNRVRTVFIGIFQGCLDLGGHRPLELAIPTLQIDESGPHYIFTGEDGMTPVGEPIPFVKLSLNKLLIAVGLSTERGETIISEEDDDVINIRNLLDMSATNVGFGLENEPLFTAYKRKLAKVLKYMGDLFQVLSTMDTNYIVYTFDRLCFITGLLLQPDVADPDAVAPDVDSINSYIMKPRGDEALQPYPKTLYLFFRVTHSDGSPLKYNNYSALIDGSLPKTNGSPPDYDINNSSISVVVRHSRGVSAKIPEATRSIIIQELFSEYNLFLQRISNAGVDDTLFLRIREAGLDDSEILYMKEVPDATPENITFLRRVIGIQKSFIERIESERLKYMKIEKIRNDFTTIQTRLSIYKEFVLSTAKLSAIENTITFLEAEQPYIFTPDNVLGDVPDYISALPPEIQELVTTANQREKLQLMPSSVKINQIMGHIDSLHKSFIDVKKQVNDVTKSIDDQELRDGEYLRKNDFVILIVKGSRRNSKCYVTNLFSAIRHYNEYNNELKEEEKAYIIEEQKTMEAYIQDALMRKIEAVGAAERAV